MKQYRLKLNEIEVSYLINCLLQASQNPDDRRASGILDKIGWSDVTGFNHHQKGDPFCRIEEPPLTRREAIGTAVFAGLLAKLDPSTASVQEIDAAVQLALQATDSLTGELDRTAPTLPKPLRLTDTELQEWADRHNLEGQVHQLRVIADDIRSVELLRDNPIPVSPDLPLCPDHIPKPPADCVYYGVGPLKVQAASEGGDDVWIFTEDSECQQWEQGACGDSYHHYALRRGSDIARANGIPD